MRVSTTYEKDTFLTKIKIPLNVDVRLIKIEGSDIVLEYSIGEKIDKIAGLKIIGKIVDRFIRGKKMEDLVTFDSSNRMRIIVHLGKYDKVTKALEIVEIKDVRFISNFVEIEFKVDLKQK